MYHYQHLALEERYMIYCLKKDGFSIRSIAARIKRSPSTVSRELRRNKGQRGYRYQQADSFCLFRRHIEHRHHRITESTWELVDSYLFVDWSPEQISHYFRLEHRLEVSTESIYQHIWADKRIGGDLHSHLRQSRKKRRKRYGCGYNYRGHIRNRVSIDLRPSIVEDRGRYGDWEIDTIVGKAHKGALVSIVERKSRFTLIGKVEKKDADAVSQKTTNLLKPFSDYVLTITGDNGKEFAGHEQLSKQLNIDFYFAHPYSSWERGLNENTNGLIRQYVPKGSSIDEISEEKIEMIMDRLNNRPRKCLGFKTPKDILFSIIDFSSPHGERKRNKRQKAQSTCTVAVTN